MATTDNGDVVACVDVAVSPEADRAFAIWQIVCDEANKWCWDVLSSWVAKSGLDVVIAVILDLIKKHLPHLDTEQETVWWREQLAAGLN